jgi:hypothetical protein
MSTKTEIESIDEHKDNSSAKKRRKWPWILLAILFLLTGIVAGAPWILSTGPGTSLVETIASSQLDGTVEIQDLSLSWGSACRIDGLTLSDSENREVVSVEQMTWSQGLWSGAMQWEQLGELVLSQPEIVLYMQKNGKTSLEEVFAKFLKEEESEPMDETMKNRVESITGSITLQDGLVRLVNVDGSEIRWEQIRVTTKIQTLADLKTELSLSSPDIPLPSDNRTTHPAETQSGTGKLTLSLNMSMADIDGPVSLNSTGELEVTDASGKNLSPVTLKLDQLTVQPDGDLSIESLVLNATGRMSLSAKDLQAAFGERINLVGDVELKADIAKCMAAVAPIAGMENPPELAGMLTFNTKALSVEKGFQLSGSGLIAGFEAGTGKKKIREERIDLTHHLTIDPTAEKIHIKEILIRAGTLMSLSAKDIQAAYGDKINLVGDVELKADLAKCMAAIAPIAGMEQPPKLAGMLTFNTKAGTTADGFNITGQGAIVNFVAGEGKKIIREPRVTLPHDISIHTRTKSIQISRAGLIGQLLKLNITGGVTEYDTRVVLDLIGEYSGSWDRVMILLHQIMPDTKEMILLGGPFAGKLKLKGPVGQPPKGKPGFYAMTGDAGLGWERGEAMGLTLGEANLSPSISNATVALGNNNIPVSGGTFHVGGTVDLSQATARYRLPGDVVLMDKVQVNEKFGKVFLSRINPIFSQVASLEGTVSLKTKDLDIPFGEELQKSGSGSGHLDISNMKLKPTGMLGLLLKFGGLTSGKDQDVKFSGVDFELKNGQITYDNFTMTFPGGFDLVFRGAVGFDDSLDLVVSIPIRTELFKKLGVAGPLQQYAQVLTGDDSRIEIPILGTRLAPKMGDIDIEPIVNKAIKALLKKQGGGLLDDLLGGQEKPDKTKPAKEKPDKKRPSALDLLKIVTEIQKQVEKNDN